jgi:hypothetical protein
MLPAAAASRTIMAASAAKTVARNVLAEAGRGRRISDRMMRRVRRANAASIAAQCFPARCSSFPSDGCML